MPSKRRFTVPAEVEAEPIAAPEPIATSVDHSTSNGLTVTVTDIPSHEWEGQRIPELERQLAEAKDIVEKLRKPLARAKFNAEVLRQSVPELDAMKEAQRLAEEAVVDLTSHLGLARAEMVTAQAREAANELQRRTTAAMTLVSERMPLTVRFDRAVRELGIIAEQLERNARTLSGYDDVTKVALHRMQLSSSYAGAIFALAPALARVLQLERTKPFPQYSPLAQTEVRHWQRFTPVTIPEIDDATGDTKPAIDPAIMGEHGAVVRDTIRTAGNVYEVGELLSPELVTSWPIKNRLALVGTGKLEFLPAPKQDSEPDA